MSEKVPNTPSRVYPDEPVSFSLFSHQDYLDMNGVSLIPSENVMTPEGPGNIMARVRPGVVRVSFGNRCNTFRTKDLARIG